MLSPVESTTTNQIQCAESKPSSPSFPIEIVNKTALSSKNALRLSSSFTSSVPQMSINPDSSQPEVSLAKLSHSPSYHGIIRSESPRRKYFDSGDYELAKAGIVNVASVGSIHASPERLAASSSRCWSTSSHQLTAESLFNSSSTSAFTLRPPHNHHTNQHTNQHNNNSSPIKQSFSVASLDDQAADQSSPSLQPSFHASRLHFSIPENDQMRE